MEGIFVLLVVFSGIAYLILPFIVTSLLRRILTRSEEIEEIGRRQLALFEALYEQKRTSEAERRARSAVN